MVGINVLWNTYLVGLQQLGSANPNFSCAINLNTAGPNSVSQTWNIQSVYIDNEGVDFPVYVYFPDTGFAVSCPANSAGWYQIFTNARQALICGVGITNSAIAAGQQTNVFFTDVPMVPSLDQEIQSSVALFKASSVINSNGATIAQPNFGAPALGDQLRMAFIQISTNGPVPVFPDITTGFIYISAVRVDASNLASGGSGASGATVNISVTTLLGNQTLNIAMVLPQTGLGTPPPGVSNLFYMNGMNWKIPASPVNGLFLFMTVALGAPASGNIAATFNFTTNPT